MPGMKRENADYILPSKEEPIYTASRQNGTPNVVYRMCRSSDGRRVVGAWMLYEDLNSLFMMKRTRGWDVPTDRNPPFEIRPTVDKGRGMFATRDIRRGECILRERPLLMAPMRLYGPTPGRITTNILAEKGLLQCVYWLEPEDRKEVLNLHNCKPIEECGPLFGIVRTNGMGADYGMSKMCQTYSCVGLKASMANHSCSPNTDHNIQVSDPLIMMHAVRNIRKDEEITTHYLDPILPRTQRLDILRKEFGFECSCSACALVGSDIRASDKRRRFIGETLDEKNLEKGFESWLLQKSDRFLDRLLTTLDYMDKERMHIRRDAVLEMLATVYACLGDKRNFQRWCSELSVVVHGRDDRMREDQRASWLQWMRSPETMPHWGVRAKARRK